MHKFSNSALKWLCIILEERFGYEFILEYETESLKLMLVSSEQGSILFPKLVSGFHESRSDLPCAEWFANQEGWEGGRMPAPNVSALSAPLIELEPGLAIVNYDILGLIYWALNRIEEIGRTDLDSNGRFPAINSHAYQHGYLERPVVDEWLEVLGQVIKQQWPEVELKKHGFNMKVSHDVDSPCLYQFSPWKSIFRMMASQLIRHRDIKSFLQAPYIKLTAGSHLHEKDPYNTFDWLMDVSEANNLTSAFYFICGRTSDMDADYEPEQPAVRELMHRIHQRGHEIGLHPSYGTYQKTGLIKQEADRLRLIMQKEGIDQVILGGRMHYLRWEHPKTMQLWDGAGMSYDSTLGYADRPGFRCGTCFEYPAFDPVLQDELNLRIRPLIVMESTLLNSGYLHLSNEDIGEVINQLKKVCRNVGGTFTLLWHNSSLSCKEYRSIYIAALEG